MFKPKKLPEEKTEKREYKILNIQEALEIREILNKYPQMGSDIVEFLGKLEPMDFLRIVNLGFPKRDLSDIGNAPLTFGIEFSGFFLENKLSDLYRIETI